MANSAVQDSKSFEAYGRALRQLLPAVGRCLDDSEASAEATERALTGLSRWVRSVRRERRG